MMAVFSSIKESCDRLRNRVADWHRRRNTLGARGERAAARYLRWTKRMHIVERSARNIYGEIDLIAVDRQRTKLIFVEVKARASHDRGHPAEAVDEEKQRRITRIALAYMRNHHLLDACSARFDVVAVTWPKGQRWPIIEHYESAFDAVGQYQMFS